MQMGVGEGEGGQGKSIMQKGVSRGKKVEEPL